MSKDKKKHNDMTPQENLAKMEKVRQDYRRRLKKAYLHMEKAQNRLRGAVEDNAKDVVQRRFRSDINIAHKEITDLLGQLYWASQKIKGLKQAVQREKEKKDLESCTKLLGTYKNKDGHTVEMRDLIHNPLKQLKSFKLG